MNNLQENQENTDKPKRGRKKGFKLNRPPVPPAPPITKSKRIPNELLEAVDKLLLSHKKKSHDKRTVNRFPTADQSNLYSKSSVRKIPLEFVDTVDAMVAAFRLERRD